MSARPPNVTSIAPVLRPCLAAPTAGLSGKGHDRMAVTVENPLVEGLERLPVPPTTLTIFGVTGDLAHRKLLPAIYNLAHEGALPERFNLVGAARRDISTDAFREDARNSIRNFSRRPPDEPVLDKLLERIQYISCPFDDPRATSASARAIEELDAEGGAPLNRVYYLSTAPDTSRSSPSG